MKSNTDNKEVKEVEKKVKKVKPTETVVVNGRVLGAGKVIKE